ncbi:MAG: NADP-dependent phosphogluconate dehydrogenase [Kofleriaceae bacterium]
MTDSQHTTADRAMGIVGLGRMGGGLALQARDRGIRVVGLTRGHVDDELVVRGVCVASSTRELVQQLAPPRAVFVYIPAGAGVDAVLEELASVLEPYDVVVDGGNSYWGDSIRRAELLARSGLGFVDLGTSGGILGARHGACFMAGGDAQSIAVIQPIVEALAVPGGFVHAGPPGAGHFTKLVHNGIEFGMLQAIGEGMALLECHDQRLPVAEILQCWRNGSVIRSWLIDLLHEQYQAMHGLDEVPSHVDDTGEVNWLVSDALQMEVPIPVIAQAVMQLLQSRDTRSCAARAIALMRHGFGGHPFGHAAAIVEERRSGRVGDLVREPHVDEM